jgi:hypothetical protein
MEDQIHHLSTGETVHPAKITLAQIPELVYREIVQGKDLPPDTLDHVDIKQCRIEYPPYFLYTVDYETTWTAEFGTNYYRNDTEWQRDVSTYTHDGHWHTRETYRPVSRREIAWVDWSFAQGRITERADIQVGVWNLSKSIVRTFVQRATFEIGGKIKDKIVDTVIDLATKEPIVTPGQPMATVRLEPGVKFQRPQSSPDQVFAEKVLPKVLNLVESAVYASATGHGLHRITRTPARPSICHVLRPSLSIGGSNTNMNSTLKQDTLARRRNYLPIQLWQPRRGRASSRSHGSLLPASLRGCVV